MNKKNVILLLLLTLLSACAPAPAPTPIPLPAYTPIPTVTPLPSPTATQHPIHEAHFAHPVDESIPMYNFYDLNPVEGEIQSNAGEEFSQFTAKCIGDQFIKGQMDNHLAYDYGVGRCGANIDGYPVYGMSIDFYGVVIELFQDKDNPARKGLIANYGFARCSDGEVREIQIQFSHVDSAVEVGDLINSELVIAYLDNISFEVEIQVHTRKVNSKYQPIGHFQFTNPQIIGLDPRLD